MDVFKIVGLGLAAAVLAVFLKSWKPEIALGISLAATCLILIFVMPYLRAVLDMAQNISAQLKLDGQYISIALKIVGIAYVVQFGAELCRDAGETAIASKIELGGKVIIMAMSMPVLYKLIEIINTIVKYE